MATKGLTYWLRGNLYISVTNKLVTGLPSVSLRGPNFRMSPDSGFEPLQPEGFEPTPDQVADAVEKAFIDKKIKVDSMSSEPVTFAGFGEPLLRFETVAESASIIRERRHGVPLRLRTTGLIAANRSLEVAQLLKSAGVKQCSVALNAHTPKQYNEIMQPLKENGLGFSDVCSFVISCVEVGMQVTCTAVERQDVNISAIRSLALSLGASNFSTYSYHP